MISYKMECIDLNDKLYPAIRKTVVVSQQSELLLDLTRGCYLKVPKDGFAVLKLIDGEKSIGELFETLQNDYNCTKESFLEFLSLLFGRGYLVLKKSPSEIVCNEEEVIKLVSLAITDKCNLKCRYCYGDFLPENTNAFSFPEICTLFNNLKRRGVEIIELTGGEPTVHPDFDKILEKACNTFEKVNILTNAVLLPEKVKELLLKYSAKISFSISIDGFSEETNKYQRQCPNTFKKTLNNIIYINEFVNPMHLRVVYMLTNDNYHELDGFYKEMLSYNITDIMVSIPENIQGGRHYLLPDGCDMSDRYSESRTILAQYLYDVMQKYKGITKSPLDRFGKDAEVLANVYPSCGAGWINIAIKADGDVIPCNLMNDKYILGNVKKTPDLSFLSRKNKYYELFSNINISFEDNRRSVCTSCEYRYGCFKCINNIIRANKKRIETGVKLCPVLKANGFTESLIMDV